MRAGCDGGNFTRSRETEDWGHLQLGGLLLHRPSYWTVPDVRCQNGNRRWGQRSCWHWPCNFKISLKPVWVFFLFCYRTVAGALSLCYSTIHILYHCPVETRLEKGSWRGGWPHCETAWKLTFDQELHYFVTIWVRVQHKEQCGAGLRN